MQTKQVRTDRLPVSIHQSHNTKPDVPVPRGRAGLTRIEAEQGSTDASRSCRKTGAVEV